MLTRPIAINVLLPLSSRERAPKCPFHIRVYLDDIASEAELHFVVISDIGRRETAEASNIDFPRRGDNY